MYNNYLHFPQINPVIFSIGPINFYWYGLMYALSFFFAIYVGKKKSKKSLGVWKKEEINNLFHMSFWGAIIGGRLGYVLFYNIQLFLNNPFYLFKIWEGGMSFHGGLIGVIVIAFYFSKNSNKSFLKITDLIAPLIPFGLGAGRLGNFINGELWGRVSTSSCFSMLFPKSREIDLILAKNNIQYQILLKNYGVLPRHPSQIYEFFLEGILLFFIMNIIAKKYKKTGITSGTFMIIYGIFRIFSEFFREPDPQLGLFLKTISMGQILSLPMIFFGIFILIYSLNGFFYKNK
ncbi:prolipoprotein diacylglyceryl transferase [Candidatus Tachikawaea gelatinosa]|uniref:prolipoprotein diacylglyceryl transferase n=1 Tax=Candidatus Tachikawaea gelatinosa TaxID=1410383 RepID=UPI000596BB01|nr:prolipoprotein diacylglyceryl transferase [Candidatus Tachikawaea gelatinosa]